MVLISFCGLSVFWEVLTIINKMDILKSGPKDPTAPQQIDCGKVQNESHSEKVV